MIKKLFYEVKLYEDGHFNVKELAYDININSKNYFSYIDKYGEFIMKLTFKENIKETKQYLNIEINKSNCLPSEAST